MSGTWVATNRNDDQTRVYSLHVGAPDSAVEVTSAVVPWNMKGGPPTPAAPRQDMPINAKLVHRPPPQEFAIAESLTAYPANMAFPSSILRARHLASAKPRPCIHSHTSQPSCMLMACLAAVPGEGPRQTRFGRGAVRRRRAADQQRLPATHSAAYHRRICGCHLKVCQTSPRTCACATQCLEVSLGAAKRHTSLASFRPLDQSPRISIESRHARYVASTGRGRVEEKREKKRKRKQRKGEGEGARERKGGTQGGRYLVDAVWICGRCASDPLSARCHGPPGRIRHPQKTPPWRERARATTSICPRCRRDGSGAVRFCRHGQRSWTRVRAANVVDQGLAGPVRCQARGREVRRRGAKRSAMRRGEAGRGETK